MYCLIINAISMPRLPAANATVRSRTYSGCHIRTGAWGNVSNAIGGKTPIWGVGWRAIANVGILVISYGLLVISYLLFVKR
jgi:hypothetical protein